MKRQLLIGGAMCAATLLIVLCGSARAGPPPEGWTGSFQYPMVVCHVKDDLKSLIAAHKESDKAFDTKVISLMRGDNPKCQLAQVSNMIVGDSEDVGEMMWDGKKEHAWIVHFGDMRADHYGFYEEPVESHETSI